MAGGFWADRLDGERTALLALFAMLIGSVLMSFSASFRLSVATELLMAIGMGVNNAAVFKMVPTYLPEAVGGASGLVGDLGAFGGFVLPHTMGFIVELRGSAGYASSFLLFASLALICLLLAAALKVRVSVRTSAELEEQKVRVA